MLLDAALMVSLEALGAVMDDAQDPWWVIASATVALHGADPGQVSDVDVLLSTRDARRILPTLGIVPQQGSAHRVFRSGILGGWHQPPLTVEFMADFHYRPGTACLRVEPKTWQPVELRGTTVYIPEREDLHRLLVDLGRPKDLEHALNLAKLG